MRIAGARWLLAFLLVVFAPSWRVSGHDGRRRLTDKKKHDVMEVLEGGHVSPCHHRGSYFARGTAR